MTTKIGTETPLTGVSVQEYVDILRRDKTVMIPCPWGMGEYFISVEDMAGVTGYGTPILIFASNSKNDSYGLKAAPAHLRSRMGRQILWYPRGLGYNLYQDVKNKGGDKEHMLRLAKMLVGLILSGRRLYMMRCGENINSLQDDGNPWT